jgi:hypothetical protein
MGVIYIVVWLVVGPLWWKLLAPGGSRLAPVAGTDFPTK